MIEILGSSLFGVLLHTASEKSVARMVYNYRYSKIGASWGGFESLVVPADPAAYRTAVPLEEHTFTFAKI